MKLYYSPGACSLAPHIILRETGADFTLEKVDIAAKKTETGADFLAINPKGYVPALQFDDGEVLTEGSVMHQYIADLKPETKLAAPRGTRERLRQEELLAFLSTELHKTFAPMFSPATPADYKTITLDKLKQRFDGFNALLSDGRAFLTGPQFTIADAYFFTLSNWTRFVGLDLANWPHVAAYAGRVAQRPAVQAALKAEGLA